MTAIRRMCNGRDANGRMQSRRYFVTAGCWPSIERDRLHAAFSPPATPARPVVESLMASTLTDRYRWLENGKDAEVAALDARAARGNGRMARKQRAPGARACATSSTRLLRSRRDAPAVLQEGPRILPAHAQGRAAGEALHAARRTASGCCSIRPRSIPPGRRRSAPSCPRDDGAKLAVGDYARGIRDQRLPDHRHARPGADRAGDHRRPLVRLGARRALRVTSPRAPPSPTRGRSRCAAFATGSAAIARPTSSCSTMKDAKEWC